MTASVRVKTGKSWGNIGYLAAPRASRSRWIVVLLFAYWHEFSGNAIFRYSNTRSVSVCAHSVRWQTAEKKATSVVTFGSKKAASASGARAATRPLCLVGERINGARFFRERMKHRWITGLRKRPDEGARTAEFRRQMSSRRSNVHRGRLFNRERYRESA